MILKLFGAKLNLHKNLPHSGQLPKDFKSTKKNIIKDRPQLDKRYFHKTAKNVALNDPLNNNLINLKMYESNNSLEDVSIERIRALEDNIVDLKKTNIQTGIAGIVGMVGITALYIWTY